MLEIHSQDTLKFYLLIYFAINRNTRQLHFSIHSNRFFLRFCLIKMCLDLLRTTMARVEWFTHKRMLKLFFDFMSTIMNSLVRPGSHQQTWHRSIDRSKFILSMSNYMIALSACKLKTRCESDRPKEGKKNEIIFIVYQVLGII